MIDNERRVNRGELLATYPHLEEWFDTNNIAQLRGSERLSSAQEKIERLGGINRVKTNLEDSFKKYDPVPGVLQACRFAPMIGIEIINFFQLLNQHLDPATLEYTIQWIEDDNHDEIGTLETIEGLTLVQKLRFKPDTWRIVERIGHLTVYSGTPLKDPSLVTAKPRLALSPNLGFS